MESKRCFFFVAHMSTEPHLFEASQLKFRGFAQLVAFAAGAAEIFKQQDASGRHEAGRGDVKGFTTGWVC